MRGYLSLFSMLLVSLAGHNLQAQSCSASTPANCAYITNFTGREVQITDRTTGGLTTLFTFTSSGLTSGQPQDATVGPDSRLYITAPVQNKIVRINLNGTGFELVYSGTSPSAPQGPRLSSTGDLYFNSPAGVFKIIGAASVPASGTFAAPVQVTSTSSSSAGGLAFRADGSLLIASNNTVLISQAVNGVPSGSTQTLLTTSNPIVGLAVNSADDVLVARGSEVTRFFNCTQVASVWSCQSQALASFAAEGHLPAYIESVPDTLASGNTADDLLFVGTADANGQNGKVWRVNAQGAKTLLATEATKVQGKFVPAVGVAVPATARNLAKLYSLGQNSKIFNFGAYSIQITNDLAPLMSDGSLACDAGVTAAQESPAALNQILANSGINGTVIPFFGEEGWVTTFHIQKPPCFSEGSLHYLAGFFQPINPRVIDIPDDYPATPATVTPTLGFYPSGALGGAPGDPGVENFGSSKLVLANVALVNTYFLCGFLSPVIDPVTDPATQNIFNANQNITFKFQLTTAPNCGGSVITDAQAQAVETVFSVAQLSPTFDRKFVDPSGSSIPVPPRFKYDPGNNQFLYTLDATALNAPTGTSVYEATVISDSFLPHSVRFTIQH